MRYGPDGRPAKRSKKPQRGGGGVAWAAPPAALALSGPYVVALSDFRAEARLLEPLGAADLWQQLPLALPGSAAAWAVAPSAAPDGSVLLASRENGAVKQVGGDWSSSRLLWQA